MKTAASGEASNNHNFSNLPNSFPSTDSQWPSPASTKRGLRYEYDYEILAAT